MDELAKRKIEWLNEIMENGPIIDTPDYLRILLNTARDQLRRRSRVSRDTKNEIRKELLRRKEPIDDLLKRLESL